MSIAGVYFFALQAFSDPDSDIVYVSVTARFDPQTAFAQTGLTFANSSFGSISFAGIGIGHYETRPDSNKPDQSTDFSFDYSFGYPPCVFADQMTVVTGEMAIGDGVHATGQMTVYLFD